MAEPYTLRGAAENALAVLEAVTRQFTRTPSTLRDSQVRGMAHEAMKELRAALDAGGVAVRDGGRS